MGEHLGGIDFSEGKHSLTSDAPGFVGIGIITYDLGGNHKSRDEQVVPGATRSDNKLGLWSLQEVESGKGYRGHREQQRLQRR